MKKRSRAMTAADETRWIEVVRAVRRTKADCEGARRKPRQEIYLCGLYFITLFAGSPLARLQSVPEIERLRVW
jgi:hypothetical protein